MEVGRFKAGPFHSERRVSQGGSAPVVVAAVVAAAAAAATVSAAPSPSDPGGHGDLDKHSSRSQECKCVNRKPAIQAPRWPCANTSVSHRLLIPARQENNATVSVLGERSGRQTLEFEPQNGSD